MRILYPHDPLIPTQADGPYQAEYEAALAAGLPCFLFDFETIALEELSLSAFSSKDAIAPKDTILYRGWMLPPNQYQTLTRFIQSQGGVPMTSAIDYLKCHYLPEWYNDCRELTAETYFFTSEADIVAEATALGWFNYFVKDYVKSNTGDKGSIAESPADIPEILEQLALYRGEIEGGIALRQVERYLLDTETRYFVVKGIPYSVTGEVPDLVRAITHQIKAPFYSVDIASTPDGQLRLIELGDGQVSGRKHWSVSEFIQLLLALT